MAKPEFDVVIRGGTLYDGSGVEPVVADLAIDGDRIAAVGDLSGHTGRAEIDASGLAVAPGFINMLSWANESLIEDGRSLSDIRQGVTLEVMGEGNSMGPLNETMRQEMVDRQSDIEFDVTWTTLGEYLQHLEDRGISTNVASFVGAATVRIHEMGYEDRDPTPEELDSMLQLVRVAMEEGAVGVGSSLPYIPAPFAKTEELIALAQVAAEHDGMYISHIRNEGDEIFAALEEFLTIVRESGVRGEIYHLKVSHKRNWDKLDEVVALIEAARAEGLPVTADIYTYHASSTGLNYDLPAWVKEGDHEERTARLKDPAVRERVIAETEMIPSGGHPPGELSQPRPAPSHGKDPGRGRRDAGHLAGGHRHGPDCRGRQPHRHRALHHERGQHSPEDRAAMGQPLLRFRLAGTRAAVHQLPATSAGLRLVCPPARQVRARGGIIPLEEAIHRLTGLPASNLKLAGPGRAGAGLLRRRRRLRPGDRDRQGDLRGAPPVGHRRRACVRQRRAGVARWRAHRGHTRAGSSKVPDGSEATDSSWRLGHRLTERKVTRVESDDPRHC